MPAMPELLLLAGEEAGWFFLKDSIWFTRAIPEHGTGWLWRRS
jgi:hypothetical protein